MRQKSRQKPQQGGMEESKEGTSCRKQASGGSRNDFIVLSRKEVKSQMTAKKLAGNKTKKDN